MEFEEYPKALYRDGAHIEVKDQAEEDAKRGEGFDDWKADHEKANGAATGDSGDEPAELTRDQMKAKADELGLTYPGNISNAKLAELIATRKE